MELGVLLQLPSQTHTQHRDELIKAILTLVPKLTYKLSANDHPGYQTFVSALSQLSHRSTLKAVTELEVHAEYYAKSN